ncbi:CaiB/BaiF CoA transferase family protein [Altererythrobacter lutimaris]|uniref:CoA transferase n=1 Tax=Altererythrobacter lutimaris TaxID=2743979 RepID=A0A850HFY8_9SPHN|nr:CaiB/BaiF CoA-transferase family protein [Altererythrobacter lutimaris]NVE93472.1 CoA transferase [Altererythrobacter lutimaris]
MQDDLNGVLVVSLEQAVAAPYASSRLADAGARVIKIERPEGDFARNYDTMVKGESAYFVWLNRGKESLCLDLREKDDRALLLRMIARADVFIENLKPGTLAKFGVELDALCDEHNGLIACSISGFGEEGPYSKLKAYDLIVQGEAGLCAITGTAHGPARVGVSVCDIAAGMTAHAAILQALFRREREGHGRRIRVSLFDALADWMNVPFLQYAYGGYQNQRSGVNHPSIAPYGAFPTGEGKQVIFSVQNQREWYAFCEHVMGDAALAEDPLFKTNMERLDNRSELESRVRARFSELRIASAMELLERSGIAYGRLNSIAELAEHPHLRRLTVNTDAGEVHVIAPGALYGDSASERVPTVPSIGAQSAEMREEFSE